MDDSYTDSNAHTIDRWVENGWQWGKPISHAAFEKAKAGIWDVLLTPLKPVPKSWFCPCKNARILGLASGGGQQMPIFSALGAHCTVLDYAPSQLRSERIVAEREGYAIDLVRADMTRPLPFPDGSFDLIFHPVSNCYIREILPLWKECYRVLKKGGILLSGFDTSLNYLLDDEERTIVRGLPFDPLQDEELRRQSIENDWGLQFSHSLTEEIGGQLQAGFTLTDIYEDTNGEGRLQALHIPTFVATRSVKDTL